jgi:hypothetical protein
MKKLLPGVAAVAMLAAAVPLAGAASTTTLKASMTGKAEAPGPGDANGKGQATIRINGKRVCWSVSYSKIAKPSAGHIHKGAKGKAGPVVVGLFATAGKKSGCVNTTSALAKDIAKHPGRYYVNLHNSAFPNGAIRGQLHR